MFALGAMPMVPVQAGPRSERMSPNRLLATTTSNQSGCITKFAVRIARRRRFHAFVPVRHGDRNPVALRRRGLSCDLKTAGDSASYVADRDYRYIRRSRNSLQHNMIGDIREAGWHNLAYRHQTTAR